MAVDAKLIADSLIECDLVPYTDEVDAAFSGEHLNADGEPLMPDDFYRREWEAGRMVVVRWSAAAVPLALTGLRREEIDGVAEMVIVAAASLRDDLPVMGAILPALDVYADKWGCRSIRFHTSRDMLAEKSRAFGYERAEIVMRRVLDVPTQ